MISELKRRLEGRRRRVLARPRAASVLVPLVEDGGEFGLVLTRRSEDLPTHKGQVAFPGGHVDPADAGPVAAALREAQEEIGLPPDRVEVLGLLDDFPTRHDDTAVTPVVGWIPELPPLRPEPGEVARIFRIPLAALARPEAWRSQMVRHGGRSYPLYFFEWDGELLWGLSAYITLALLAETPLGPPFPLPDPRLR